MVGEIYLAPVYFTDGTRMKIRPILIVKENAHQDLLYFPITSNLSVGGVLLSSTQLSKGALPKTSVIVTDKIGTIAKSQLLRFLARVNGETLDKAVQEFIAFLSTRP